MRECPHVPPPMGQRIISGAAMGWKLCFLVDGGYEREHCLEYSRSWGVILVGVRLMTTSLSFVFICDQDPNREMSLKTSEDILSAGRSMDAPSPPLLSCGAVFSCADRHMGWLGGLMFCFSGVPAGPVWTEFWVGACFALFVVLIGPGGLGV